MHKRNLPNRKSIRLKGWDYRNPGLYFVTICTKGRQHHFGEIRQGKMGLSVQGCIVNYYWTQIINQFHSVELDEHIIMPNHIHGIVAITRRVAIHGGRSDGDSKNDKLVSGFGRDESRPHRSDSRDNIAGSSVHRDRDNKKSGGVTGKHNPMLYETHLGKIIRWFKGRCTFEIRHERKYARFAWQSRFYDHIIRDEKELNRIRKYIYDNPLRWQVDKENTDGEYMHKQGVKHMVGSLN